MYNVFSTFFISVPLPKQKRSIIRGVIALEGSDAKAAQGFPLVFLGLFECLFVFLGSRIGALAPSPTYQGYHRTSCP